MMQPRQRICFCAPLGLPTPVGRCHRVAVHTLDGHMPLANSVKGLAYLGFKDALAISVLHSMIFVVCRRPVQQHVHRSACPNLINVVPRHMLRGRCSLHLYIREATGPPLLCQVLLLHAAENPLTLLCYHHRCNSSALHQPRIHHRSDKKAYKPTAMIQLCPQRRNSCTRQL